MKTRRCRRKVAHESHEWSLDGLGYSTATGGVTQYRGKDPTRQRQYWCSGKSKNNEQEKQ